MKYLFTIATLLLLLTSCGNNSNTTMNVIGEIKGLKKGTILLQRLNDTVFTTMDSLVVDGSSNFNFSEELDSPEVFYLTLKFDDSITAQKQIAFFAEAGEISIQSNLKNYELDTKITGSVNQQKWEEHALLIERYNNKNLDLIEERLNAFREGNDSLSAVIEERQNKLMSSQYLATVNYALNNKDYEVAPYLMLSEVYDANIKYLDTIYTSLTPKIKDSKYGKALESYIKQRKN